jgi:hypothetical protein
MACSGTALLFFLTLFNLYKIAWKLCNSKRGNKSVNIVGCQIMKIDTRKLSIVMAIIYTNFLHVVIHL